MMTVLVTLLVCLLLSVSAGIAATSYVNILTQPGQVLAGWARFLYQLRDQWISVAPTDADQRKRESASEYVLKPILTCVYCVSGQLGFWLSLFYAYVYDAPFSLVWALLTAVLSVWFGGLFQSIQKKHFPL